jgi:hypothetical protein
MKRPGRGGVYGADGCTALMLEAEAVGSREPDAKTTIPRSQSGAALMTQLE